MNEESLFHEALARSTPEERAAFLDEACAGRPELRAAVESLLAAHGQPGAFLAGPPVLVQAQSDDSRTTGGGAPAAAQETANPADSTGADSVPTADVPERVGRYLIRRLLGQGGMGAVYLAHDPELDRPVALKVPRLDGPEAEERFLREARAAAALSHANLCPVHDVGRADGVPYLAMAYLPGPTLAEVIRQEGPLPPARCAAIVAAVARGMAEAHRHGVIHRDLKPGNILLDGKAEPVVTDFGLAFRTSAPAALTATTVAHQPRLTEAGILMGTPAYMPPEQARGDLDQIGPASDVYSLGAILFEMLTGRLLFAACPLHEMVRLIETQPVPLPSSVRRGVLPGLDALCRRALAKDPARRIASMDEFAEALTPFAVQRSRRGRVAVVAAALALLALLAGAVFYVKTDYGTVEVRMNDASADVKVAVDGNEITLTDGGRVTKLRPGPHALEVKGEGFESETKLFKVTRGKNTLMEVELKPKPPAGPPDEAPRPPVDRARLARLLAEGRRVMDERQLASLEVVASEALKIDPESPRALALRAAVRLAPGGNRKAAREEVEKALRLNPETFEALFVRAELNGQEARSRDAIADATAVLRLEPKYAAAWAMRAKAYMDLKEYAQAAADASRAIEYGNPTPEAHIVRATAYVFLGEYEKALKDFDTAAERAPGYPPIFSQRSVIHAKLGHTDLAAADWKKVKELDPGRPDDARPVIPDPPKPPQRKKLTPQEAEAEAAALRAAEGAWDAGRLEACVQAAEQAVRIDPTNARAREVRARVWVHQQRYAEAHREADEAVRLDPLLARAYQTRGTTWGGLKSYAEAIADFCIAIDLDRTLHLSWNNRGWTYMERGQYHQALADLNEALQLKPDGPEARANRAKCYLHLGEYKKALADYVKMAEIQPRVGRWLLICAAVRTRLGDADGAEKDRKRAVEIDGDLKDAPPINLPAPIPPVKKDPEPPPGEP
jgi:tetratricopeptide (TPR) repeat protein